MVISICEECKKRIVDGLGHHMDCKDNPENIEGYLTMVRNWIKEDLANKGEVGQLVMPSERK